MMFYVIETTYIGPNRGQRGFEDPDTIEVSGTPLIDAATGETLTEGKATSSGDWAQEAHGCFHSLENASAFIKERFGLVRSESVGGVAFESDDPDVIAVFKTGELEPMSVDGYGQWAHHTFLDGISAEMSDEKLRQECRNWADEEASEGWKVPDSLFEDALAHRDELRRELVEQSDD
jgi:hypothetical protein